MTLLSPIGQKMAAMSGLRSIMDDIAISTAGTSGQWLNLSIGNPASIPAVTSAWRQLTEEALADDFDAVSCSYGPSRGSQPLVDAIVDYFNQTYHWGMGPENVIVGPGSQMLCFIAAAIFTGGSPDSRVVLPLLPDYTGYQGLCLRSDGIAGVEPRIEPGPDHFFRYSLDQLALEQRDDLGMLLASSPSNPAGRSLDARELVFLAKIARQRGIPLMLDNAYGEPFPRIGQTLVPPMFDDTIINCFSISKAGLPGERIGFAIGPECYITPMVSFITNSVLHAPRLAQAVVARALRSGQLDMLSASVIAPFYASRRQLADELLADNLPANIDWRVHAGRGGMFCWLWVNESWFDDLELYRRLKLKRVFVAPGRSFFLDTQDPPRVHWHGTQCFRISLTPDEATVAEGIRRIADALRELRTDRHPSP
jgi:valine--pyruvate aminotransferase